MFYDSWLPSRRRPRPWKGAFAGLVGGFAASWVMGQFQNAVPAEAFAELLGEDTDSGGGSGDDEEPATVEAAEGVSEGVFDHRLTKAEKKKAGPAMHYGLGTAAGAAYGAAAELWPTAASGFGLPFGTAFWLGADEVAVPTLGLSKPPTEQPASTHLYALASHLVYGLTTDVLRRGIRRLL